MDGGGKDQLLEWLTGLGLAEYHAVLVEKKLHSTRLLARTVLSADQLTAIGITKMGHRNRLFRAIEKLRGEQSVAVPPPVPHRNTKRSTSNPNPGSATLQPGVPRVSSIHTPPPPKRNQSLRRKTPSPVDPSPPRGMASFSPHATTTASVNGSHENDRVPTTNSKQSAAMTVDSSPHVPPSPIAPRRADSGNPPAPAPRTLRPVPRPRQSKSPSPSSSDSDGSRAFSTLPANSRSSIANGDVQSVDLSKSYDSAMLSTHRPPPPLHKMADSSLSDETPPPPLPPERKTSIETPPPVSTKPVPHHVPPPQHKIADLSSSNEAPFPERKKSIENPPPVSAKPVPPAVARKPVLPHKGVHTLPPKERPMPPPPFHTTKGVAKPEAPLPSIAPRPRPQPRSTTLPSHQPPRSHRPPAGEAVAGDKQEAGTEAKGSVVFLSGRNEDLSDSEDDELPSKTQASITSSKRPGDSGNDTAPMMRGRVTYKSAESESSDEEKEEPPRKMAAVRQLSSSLKLDHEDDIVVGTLPKDSGPDYMNQKSIDSALADVSGEEDDDDEDDDDEEEEIPRERLRIGQVRTIDRGKDSILTMTVPDKGEDYVNQKVLEEDNEEEDEEEELPGNRLRIGQVRTIDRGKDADSILTMTRPDQNEDYVNQEALEEDNEDEDEEEVPGKRLVIGQVRTIDRGQDVDRILTMTKPDHKEDFVNQKELEKNDDSEEEEADNIMRVAIHSQKEDYVNQVELDKMEVVSPGATADGIGYRTQDVLGLEGMTLAVGGLDGANDSQADYVNDSALGPIDSPSGQAPMDSIPVTTSTAEGNPDYMNDGDLNDGYIDDDEFWKSIDATNAANRIVIKSVAVKSGTGDRGDYSNQDVIDSTMKGDFGGLGTDEYLTEDDYYTTDDDEDDEKIKVRNTARARLKIKGTLKSPELVPDTGKDYENQDVLEEDIIPMMVAPGSGVMNCLMMAASQGGTTSAERSCQPEAVVSGYGGGLVSPTGSTGTDDADTPTRSPVCTSSINESTLDFKFPRNSIGNSKSPPPLPPKSPPKSPPIFIPPSPPSSLPPATTSSPPSLPPKIHSPPSSLLPAVHSPPPPATHSPPNSLSRTSTSSSSASSIRGVTMEGQSPGLPPPSHPGLSVMRQDTYPISSKLRSHTFADPVNHREAPGHKSGLDEPLVSPRSSRSSDAEFVVDESGTLSSNHIDYIPPRLPKSAGTFGGRESYKRPGKSVSQVPLSSRMSNSQEFKLRSETLSESALFPGVSGRLGSLGNVPQTKEGFLYKKGGRRNERPWQKRWVTFNGSELKYFKNKTDKDNLFLNAVELEKMFDVKRVADEAEKQYRFDLVVVNRVFQFYSDSADDCQAWVDVLHVAISKFKPQDHEHKIGGTMHDPDKEGYLNKQGHGAFSSKSFRERYVALKGSKFAYYDSYELFKLGRPIHTLDMCLSSVRPDMTSKVPRFIITMNNQKQYHFQASTDVDRNEWITALTNAILTGIETRPQTLPRGGTKSINNSQAVLSRVQENPANKTCADCQASDPVWGVINRGIMVCINCSGVHRSFGAHISKVRSIELDEEVWKNENLKQLMVEIGNDNSNSFWQRHYKGDKLASNEEKEIREDFLRAKYLTRSWIPSQDGETKDSLSLKLCENVTTNNFLRTIELIALGADTCYVISDEEDPDKSTPLAIARSHNQPLQAELLELNGALVSRQESSYSIISKKGHLFKTGSDRTGWKKRYCTLDQFRGFEYFKVETEVAPLGDIRVEELLSVSRYDEEVSREHRFCFEVNTPGRGYLFSAGTEAELEDWVDTFQKIISSDAAENLGYDKVGYLKKPPVGVGVGGWKKRWYTLKGKSLLCYKREREEQEEIDLRKVVELKGPDSSGSPEQQCLFSIVTDDKTFQLKAESLAEAESWVAALRHTQVSGIPLGEQILTNGNVPIIVHKCLQFVESTGLDIEGLYRINGEKAKIRKLILAFNQDAQGVVIDPEKFNVHDVTGTLKQFLRSLPHPVLTHELYPDFIDTVQAEHETQLYRLQALIQKLPEVNRETLKRIISHLRRVIDNEAKNKMNEANITRLLGPTLMTVDGDDRSFDNTPYQYMCIHRLITYYKWLFNVEEDESKKEEAIEVAVQKIKELELQQKKRLEMVSSKQSSISHATDFLTTVFIGMRDGDSFNTHITGSTTVQQVVEKTIASKGLPPDRYALYLILGDTESQRVLCFSERLLGVMCDAGTEHYLCLRRNEFYETLEPHFPMGTGGSEVVAVHVREKKKWKKFPCCVKANYFIQYKDSKCHSEAYKIAVNQFDVFAGIQRSKMDVKNPMPSRYGFWIKAMKGEDQCRYLCADKQDDMMKLIAAIIKAKYPDCLQSPVLPEEADPPPSYSALYEQ